MDLGEVLKTYLGGDHQGQLVVKFVGESHLCKISIENGEAVYLTLGNMGPEDTLDAIVGKAAEWNNFINGMPARKRLDQPVTQLLLNIAGAAPPAQGAAPVSITTEETPAATENIVIEGDADSTQVGTMISRFIDLVGPLGTILAERICSNLSYTDGATMDAATYSRFISALAAEIPDDDRQGFIDAAKK